MASNKGEAPAAGALPVATSVADANPKKLEDLVPLAQTEEARRLAAELGSDVVVPKDLTKVSAAKARELAEAGVVEDRDLPGKMYRRKYDGFVTRIPDYTFEAYAEVHQDEWEEIKLTSDEPAPPVPAE